MGFATTEEFVAHVRGRWAEDAEQFLAMYPATSAQQMKTSMLTAFTDEVTWNVSQLATSPPRTATKRSYLYHFTHAPPGPRDGPMGGATHTAEIRHVFNNPMTDWSDEDRRIGDVLSSYWANFASRGDPNGAGLPTWPAVDSETPVAMRLGSDFSSGAVLDVQRMELFKRMFQKSYGAR